jgi:hypothetical protein
MRLLVSTLALSLLSLTFLGAQQPPGGGGRGAPKNLKILKPDDYMAAMRTFTSGLGQRCDFCHVQGDFGADDKPQKVTARAMIAMTQQINTHFPGGDAKVTCYTCHHGAAKPLTAPPPGDAPPGR